MRIRKIIPREAWRLMGFLDDDYNKASEICCETALYKQVCNSIIVDVIFYILKELLVS